MAWWDTCKNGGCTGWKPAPNCQGYGAKGYRSDYSVPLDYGTPVESPVNGIVLPQHTSGGPYSAFGQQSFGGELDMVTVTPEYGIMNVGVIHLDSLANGIQPGVIVKKGDIIGTSGGQQSGGNWPAGSASTGPHIGLQVHAFQSWCELYDPAKLMASLMAGKNDTVVPDRTQLQLVGLGNLKVLGTIASGPTGNPSLTGADTGSCAPWDIACLMGQLKGQFGTVFTWVSQPIRILKLAAGSILLMIGLVIAFLPDIAGAAVTAAGVPEAAPLVRQTLRGNKGPAGFIRSGLATGGAIQGRRTLQRRELRGVLKQQQAEHTKRSEAAKRGAQTRKANRDVGIRRVPTTPGEREMLARGRNKRYEASKATQGEPSAGGPLKPSKPGKIPSLKQRRAAENAKSEARRQQFREGLKRMGRPDLEK